MADLITDEQRERLLSNGRETAEGREQDPKPLAKLFTPDPGATWVLTELDPSDPDLAFGLCDLGLGCPELGYVRLSELTAIRGPLKQPVERRERFRSAEPLSRRLELAVARGHLRT